MHIREAKNPLTKKEWVEIKKEWLKDNEEAHFTVNLHDKVASIIENLSLVTSGRIFAAVIHTNFNEKETGLIVLDGKPINIAGFGSIFKIKSRQTITEALKELIQLGFLQKEGRKYFLNKEYHFMGKIIDKEEKFSKIYHAVNRILLQQVSSEALGLLYKLIPLVNYKTGTVCADSTEKNEEHIEILTRRKLAGKLGISESTLARRMKELNENGAVLVLSLGQEAYYKVSPRFVSKMDSYASKILESFIKEQRSSLMRKKAERKAKQTQKKRNEEA